MKKLAVFLLAAVQIATQTLPGNPSAQALPGNPSAQALPGNAAAQTFSGGPDLDGEIERAISTGLIPGAVLLVGNHGRVIYDKAYGSRSLIPTREPMTPDTIFDAASLTKVIATTSCM